MTEGLNIILSNRREAKPNNYNDSNPILKIAINNSANLEAFKQHLSNYLSLNTARMLNLIN